MNTEGEQTDIGRSLPSSTLTAAIVIPCHNEAERLDVEAFLAFAEATSILLFFVDDGSSDGTGEILERAAGACEWVEWCRLPTNRGKGEAVRYGLASVLQRKFAAVGYLDADLSTPLDQMGAMLSWIAGFEAEVVLGSRVRLLGRDIQRYAWRHYIGRVFATAASTILRLPVYDTQCGAKWFKATPAFSCAMEEPFISRWGFDVELIGRLLWPSRRDVPALCESDLVEYPLQTWRDVSGGSLGFAQMLGASRDLAAIAIDMERRRRARARGQ